MKKIIALVAATVLSATAVFAENTLHIGLGIPISPFTLSNDGDDVDFSQTGFDFAFDYTHVSESGFAFKVGFDGGAAICSSDFKDAEGDDLVGVDFAFGLGFGGSPIHNEKMTLSILGDLGFRFQDFDMGTEKEGNYRIEDWSLAQFIFYVGPEVAYTFRFNNHIGLFANLGIFYNVGASLYFYSSQSKEEPSWLDDTFTVKGLTIQPKLGLAVTF